LTIQRREPIKDSQIVGKLPGQRRDPLVVLIPIPADSLLAILQVVLRKNSRPDWLVMPTRRGTGRPMVGWQRMNFVDPAAKALDHLLARPLEAHNANARRILDRVLNIRQVI